MRLSLGVDACGFACLVPKTDLVCVLSSRFACLVPKTALVFSEVKTLNIFLPT